MADKYHSDTQNKIETITYEPNLQDSGDLEAATKTITATSEASGLGSADYSKALTLPKPDDARLVVEEIASRLAVTIDSFNGAGHLYCRVYVDDQDAEHKLFDEDWTSIGAKLDGTWKTSGTLFDLLTDGSAHTFYFFLWVDAGNAVISAVQLWEGVGNADENNLRKVITLNHCGFVQAGFRAACVGTGQVWLAVNSGATPAGMGDDYYSVTNTSPRSVNYPTLWLVGDKLEFNLHSPVQADLVYIRYVDFYLRSEQ